VASDQLDLGTVREHGFFQGQQFEQPVPAAIAPTNKATAAHAASSSGFRRRR
jgi:hypothetical protein